MPAYGKSGRTTGGRKQALMVKGEPRLIISRDWGKGPDDLGRAVAFMNRVSTLEEDRASIRLAGRVENIGRAREFVMTSLGASHPCAGVLQLIVSELVTNSIVHTRSGWDGGTVTVELTSNGQRVRVEVTDDGGPELPRVRPVDVGAESGRGLQLVEAIADAWGWDQDPGGGTITWAEVAA
jgi:anti-sigma regulatory factor (Ser/Thr protein kinase)